MCIRDRYRCGKGEDTIDCVEATAQMIGSWDGRLVYSGPEGRLSSASGAEIPSAVGVNHIFTLEILSVTECNFFGQITYGTISNNTVYEANGNIDKYGWVTFSEIKFINDGEIFTSCGQSGINNGSNSFLTPLDIRISNSAIIFVVLGDTNSDNSDIE